MLASKDVRVITASLSSASLLELQEVPKSAERLPARTFYLWHVDLARAYTALISHLYKTMANLIQRRKFEVGKMEALIEKRNRTDVKESEGELLSREDKAEIKRLDEVVEKLTLAEQRTGEWVVMSSSRLVSRRVVGLLPRHELTFFCSFVRRHERLHPSRSAGRSSRSLVVSIFLPLSLFLSRSPGLIVPPFISIVSSIRLELE